ncbi:two-component regulator propeller domain-containing protein [Fulvivirga sp. M361]|uniref:hybrid sensor histidine kinase/response regulator transcription factor n=1 Tax=Fulvivirga sp. M361 TaxID=2594266 RepID=UPI0016291400|nr:two-component regulator propeller domain-containing protein [Fulvivirga sp. M361]
MSPIHSPNECNDLFKIYKERVLKCCLLKRHVVWLFCLQVVSQAAFSQYSLNHLSVNDGLTHSDVVAIVQDISGIIWLGTNNGLNRYDGYTFQTFKHDFEDSLSLPNNRMKDLFCDSRNRVWMVTEKNFISYYESETGRFCNMLIGNSESEEIEQIVEDDEGNIWYWTTQGRLNKITWTDDGYNLTHFSMPLEVTILEILAFDSKVWIGTKAHGLWQLETGNGKISRVHTGLFRSAYSMGVLDDVLIVATDRGLYRMSGMAGWEALFLWEDRSISDIVVDYHKNIWVGVYDGGVVQLKRKQDGKYILGYTYTVSNQLSTNRVNDLMIDSFDVLWIGTSGGGAYFIDLQAKPFQVINNTNTTIPDNYVTAIHEDHDQLWVGTRHGLARVNAAGEVTVYEPERHISALHRDRTGQLWIGTRFNGLRLLQKDGTIQEFSSRGKQGLCSDKVIGISEDAFGRLWIATFNQGVTLMDIATKKILASLNENNYLPTNNLTYIYSDPQNAHVIWLGTRDAGLLKLSFPGISKMAVENYRFSVTDRSSISSNYVWPVLRTSSNTLWVGTIGGGLNKAVESPSGVVFQHFTEKDGLADNDIESILEDNSGSLWLGGKGLVRFDPKDSSFVAYDVNDGLQSNSFKIGAAFKNDKGQLYFGGINGLNYFDPEKIIPNPHKPKVIFDDLKIFNRSVSVGERIHDRVLLPKKLDYLPEITLKAAENEFTIDLLGLHYANPGQNKYAYKLEGYSQDWVYQNADQRRVTFSNLRAGSYRFMAKVSNSDGQWSENRILRINILPPWWATWWAFFAYSLLILGLLYLYGFLMRRQSALRHDLVLAEKEKDLNKQKIRFFTNISHEIRTPLTLIHSPLEEIIEEGPGVIGFSEKLGLIQKNVNRLLALTNQLLNFRKMESGNMVLQVAEGNFIKFAREICLAFQHMAHEKKIRYNFQIDRESTQLTFDRDKFEIILTNLISNAIKYTKAGGRIDIQMRSVGNDAEEAIFEKIKGKNRLSNHYLEIGVRDNGIGMSKEEVGKIFDRFYQVGGLDTLSIHGTGIGLALVKGIIDLHKGEIKVKSIRGKGSEFIVKIPFGSAHFDKLLLLKDFRDSDDRIHYPSMEEEPQIIEHKSEPSAIKQCVLIVEDNKDVLTYLGKHLRQRYRVVCAADGKEGLSKAHHYLPDLIISDVMMPEMDGLEMLSAIKRDPDLSFIPVILLTARTATVYELEGVGIGAHDYITKPFNIRILLAKVASILATRENFKRYYEAHIRLQPVTEAILPNSEQKFLDEITGLVIDNLTTDNFSVQMMVREMGMSQSACYKRIKELTGRSAVQFIRDIRLKRSAELLLTGELNVSEVAYSVGINDLKYYREKFKEQYGCNPSDYPSGDTMNDKEPVPHKLE